MSFPNIHEFREAHCCEEQMGKTIAGLLRLFSGRVSDEESNHAVLELVSTPSRWSAGHAVFDEVRERLLVAIEHQDQPRGAQYYFEESCCQAVYNATAPDDPFDPGSPFFLAGQALALARLAGVPFEKVIAVLTAPVS